MSYGRTMNIQTNKPHFNNFYIYPLKHSFKSRAINRRAKGNKKKRTCGHADGEKRKKMKT